MTNRIYDVTLAAVMGSSARIDAGGTYFKIVSAPSGPVIAKLGSGQELTLSEGQGFDMGLAARITGKEMRSFQDVTIRNATAVAQTVRVFIGSAGFVDTLTGVISTVDGERSKVQAGKVMRGVVQLAGATFPPTVQLWNSVSAIDSLVVTEVRLGMTLADSWGISTTSTPATNSSSTFVYNLDSGRSGSAFAGLRHDNTNQVFSGVRQMVLGYGSANSDNVIVFKRPILLRPGNGLNVFANAAANAIRVTYEHEEWTI